MGWHERLGDRHPHHVQEEDCSPVYGTLRQLSEMASPLTHFSPSQSLSELKQFVDLNYTGLSKVLKKYDKITNSSLRSKYMKEVVDSTFPFESVTQERLTAAIQSLVPLYADIAASGDTDFALKQLNAHLREHVVWERNTVWREMIGLERRGWGTGGAGKRAGTDVPIVRGQKAETKTELVTPVGRFHLPSWLTTQVVSGVLALLLFGGLLNADWFDRVEEQNCLALLVFVTIFWALEVSVRGRGRALERRANHVPPADRPPLRHRSHGSLPCCRSSCD